MSLVDTGLDYGKEAAYKTGSLGLGSVSTVPTILGAGMGIYGLSKIGLEEMADVADGAAASFDRVYDFLDDEDDTDDDDLHAFPEPSESSLSNIYSAAKWGLGGAVIGGAGLYGLSKAKSWW